MDGLFLLFFSLVNLLFMKSICILSAYEANRAWQTYREVQGRSDDADEDNEEEDDDEDDNEEEDDEEDDDDEKDDIFQKIMFFHFFIFFNFFSKKIYFLIGALKIQMLALSQL